MVRHLASVSATLPASEIAMSFDVTVAGIRLPTDISVVKDLLNPKKIAFTLDSRIASLLDGTLENVPVSAATTSFSYDSDAADWTPGGGPVQFGLQGGAKGSLQVINSGQLVSYADGLDQPGAQSVNVPAGVSFVSLSLNFNISANASATYSGGAYGVKAAVDTSDSYAIQFSKAFMPSTSVRIAIAKTFESFVLPLHQDTISLLSDGDYLLHEFDGNLHLSFGAYTGLDRVCYAGQSCVDVLKSCGSPLATISASAVTEVKAGAGLDFKCAYATRFEALVTKAGATAHLHLFRSSNASRSATLKAGLSFDTDPTASIVAHTTDLQNSIVSRVGGPDTLAGKALGKAFSAGTSAVASYTTDTIDKLTTWVDKADGVRANLQVAIEANTSRTILAGYAFDLTATAFPTAWKAAIAGDFLHAMATGAATLDTGSGLEQEYQRKTSFSCNLFNLWSMQTWDDFASKVSLVYAGNNVFHLQAEIGRTLETQTVGAMHSMDFYFTVAASVTESSKVSQADIDLHVDLTAQKDPRAAAKIADLLGAIHAEPAGDALARDMHAFATNAKNGTAQLQITIPATAYAKINCDAYSKDKPMTTSKANDMQNWNAFVQAAGDLGAWPLAAYPTLLPFTAWAELNQAANGSNTVNRTQTGEPFTHWPAGFPAVDEGKRPLLVYSMLAGQSFMNFCADLRDLIQVTDTNAAASTWESLIKLVTHAISADVQIDFARPAALAIVRLCGTPGAVVTGPSVSGVPTEHFAVSIRLA